VETGEPNPYLPPEAELTIPQGAAAPPGDWPPVPFEDEDAFPRFGNRLWETLKLGYTDPFGLADRVSVTEPIFPAWLFYLILQFPFSILGLALNSAFQSLMGRLTGAPVHPNMALQVVSIVVGPLIGIFISSVLLHPFLWMFGGTRKGLGLHQTIRFMGYAGALLAPVAWIPLLGALFSLVWLVLFGIGLARVHRTDTWRGVCAVLVPIAVGCCIGVVVAIALVGRTMSGRGF
jgi:hypothetical protein